MVVEGRFKPSPFRNGLQWSTRVDHNFNGGRDRVYGNYFRTTLDAEATGGSRRLRHLEQERTATPCR